LATAENDQPRVRALGFWFADESGFYFQTGSAKEFPHQLEKNPIIRINQSQDKDFFPQSSQTAFWLPVINYY
jgi:uncharacterized pyridoxamine 5'-phosphate oxidase family protein